MRFEFRVGGRRSGRTTEFRERLQAIINAPCHGCGESGQMKGTASQGGETRYFCHTNEQSCYNKFRGRYFEDPELVEIPVRNPPPTGCTCQYDYSRAMAEAEVTATRTVEDPDCPVH